MTVALGDQVRVHYHPPGQTKSFVEGVVTRVDVTTELGPMFVVAVTSDVIYDREQPFRPGYKDHILYEPRQNFPGRIEVMPRAVKEPEPEHISGSPPDAQPELELATGEQPEPEAVPASEQTEDQEMRGLGRILGAVFGRRA